MSAPTDFFTSRDDIFTVRDASRDNLEPTHAPAITFLWDCYNSTVVIPRSRADLLANPSLPICETLNIRTVFNRNELHFDIFEHYYLEIRAKALQVPRSAAVVGRWKEVAEQVPERVDEISQCPVCIDGTKPEVVFRGCCHAFCKDCTMSLGSSLTAKREGNFPCPLCRAQVNELAAVIPDGINHGDSGYHIKYDEETFAKLKWEILGAWMLRVKGQKMNVHDFLVVRLKEDGRIEIRKLSQWEGDIEVPVERKPMGMEIMTWVLLCFTKIAAAEIPVQV